MDSAGSSNTGTSSASAFDLVEPALLLPPDLPIRGGSRPDAAVVVDRELVILAGVEGHARMIQAHLVERMMAMRGWRSLGFVRLSDYARERLGLASRTLEEDAHVVRALATLPSLRVAFETRTLTWMKVRMLAHAATPANEEVLLLAATEMTTRELERFLRVQSAPPGADAESPTETLASAELTASSQHPATLDGAGFGAPSDDSAKPVDADDSEQRWDITVSRSGRRMLRSATELAQRCAGTPLSQADVLELICAEAISGRSAASSEKRWVPEAEAIEARLLSGHRRTELSAERFLEAFRAETGVIEGFAWLGGSNAQPGPALILDRMLDGVVSCSTDAPSTAETLTHVDAFELDRRLRELRLVRQRVDAQIASLLRIGADRRLFRELGFATVKLYVESRLGISSRKAWSLIAIERASWRSCPALREAWRLGRISHLAASTILPVLGERHGSAWVQRASEVTLRRLHDEVAWALDHGDRHPALDPPAPPTAGENVRADTAGDVSTEEVQMRAHDPARADTSMGPPGPVRLTFRLPLAIAALVETTLWLLGRDGEPRWRTFERVVALAILEWSSQPRHRDPIFERDGWRCAVPGCSSRRNLHDHHVVFRSKGGDNARDNRVTVCASHHLHGIHEGCIRAYGRAPDEISWELGCRRGETPLMRLRGDRVLAA